jgi:hypothetical protein
VPLQIAQIPSSVVTIIQGTIVLAVVIANEVARRLTRQQAERGSAVAPPSTGDGSTGPGSAPAVATGGRSDAGGTGR